MNKKFTKQLLSFIIAAAITITSAIPSYAMDLDQPGYEPPIQDENTVAITKNGPIILTND